MNEEQQKRREQAQEWRDQIYRDLGQLSLTDPLARVVDGMVSNLTDCFNQEIKEQADRIVELEKRPRAADKIAIIALRNLEGIFKELEIAKDGDGIIRVVKLDFPKCQRLIKDAIALLTPPVAASEAHVAAVIKQWEKANLPG